MEAPRVRMGGPLARGDPSPGNAVFRAAGAGSSPASGAGGLPPAHLRRAPFGHVGNEPTVESCALHVVCELASATSRRPRRLAAACCLGRRNGLVLSRNGGGAPPDYRCGLDGVPLVVGSNRELELKTIRTLPGTQGGQDTRARRFVWGWGCMVGNSSQAPRPTGWLKKSAAERLQYGEAAQVTGTDFGPGPSRYQEVEGSTVDG